MKRFKEQVKDLTEAKKMSEKQVFNWVKRSVGYVHLTRTSEKSAVDYAKVQLKDRADEKLILKAVKQLRKDIKSGKLTKW